VTKSILIFTLALACSTPAIAQSSTPSSTLFHREWEGTFFGGYAFSKDYNFMTAVSGSDQGSTGTVGMHYDAGYRLGARVTQNLGDFFAATLEYGFADQDLRLTNVTPKVSNLYLSQFVHNLNYNVSYSPMNPTQRFRPHVEAGVGALLFHLGSDSKSEALLRGVPLEDSWEVFFNYGIGFKHLVADRFALTVDAKGRMSEIPTYGLPKTTRLVDGVYVPAISTRGLMHTWQFNVGIAHQWDKW
jgi:opacity protein-like surface antigen